MTHRQIILFMLLVTLHYVHGKTIYYLFYLTNTFSACSFIIKNFFFKMQLHIKTYNLKILTNFILFLLVTTICSCSINSNVTHQNNTKIIQCEEIRPQICTMEYLPVCASMNNTNKRTYASGCSACSDINVTHYIPGECN